MVVMAADDLKLFERCLRTPCLNSMSFLVSCPYDGWLLVVAKGVAKSLLSSVGNQLYVITQEREQQRVNLVCT